MKIEKTHCEANRNLFEKSASLERTTRNRQLSIAILEWLLKGRAEGWLLITATAIEI